MKRLSGFNFVTCIVLCMVMLLAGCAGNKKADEAQETLKIGIDANFSPFSYKNDEGKFVGLDIELAQEAAKRLHKKAKFIPLRWAAKDEALNNGEIDCIWSCYSMDGREKKYSWTKPYMKSGQYAVIRKDSDILSLKNLQGKTIAVHSSTKFHEAVKNGTIKAGKILEFYTVDECLNAVASGKADATGGHMAVMLDRVKAGVGKSNLEVLEQQPINTNNIGVAFKKDNIKAAQELSKVLDDMYNDGTMERIVARYYLSKDVLTHEENK